MELIQPRNRSAGGADAEQGLRLQDVSGNVVLVFKDGLRVIRSASPMGRRADFEFIGQGATTPDEQKEMLSFAKDWLINAAANLSDAFGVALSVRSEKSADEPDLKEAPAEALEDQASQENPAPSDERSDESFEEV